MVQRHAPRKPVSSRVTDSLAKQTMRRLTKSGDAAAAVVIEQLLHRLEVNQVASCRVCGCTNGDCSQCVKKTGRPCHWVKPNLCSACA